MATFSKQFADVISGRMGRRSKSTAGGAPGPAPLGAFNGVGDGLATGVGIGQIEADGVLIVDDLGVVRWANLAAQQILGKRSCEIVGKVFGFPLEAGASMRLSAVRPGGEMSVSDLLVSDTEIDGEHAFVATLRGVSDRR